MTTDDTQIYVTGVLYDMESFPDDPHIVFNKIHTKFSEISGLGYGKLAINRAENRFSNGTTREQMLIFMKDVTYSGNSYLTDAQSTSLRSDLISKLNSITEITYDDVEIRTTRTTS